MTSLQQKVVVVTQQVVIPSLPSVQHGLSEQTASHTAGSEADRMPQQPLNNRDSVVFLL